MAPASAHRPVRCRGDRVPPEFPLLAWRWPGAGLDCAGGGHGPPLISDTLFVGDVGRVDLTLGRTDEAQVRGRQGALRVVATLLLLRDDVEVYPGHHAGSTCGRGMHGKTVSTSGHERRSNWLYALITRRSLITSSPTRSRYPTTSIASSVPTSPDRSTRAARSSPDDPWLVQVSPNC